ncbi:peptidyl-prolyl cis-trans isomerase FKBP5-like isoform X1 [Montipora foliosa]|uniref:peptidyl-prolyl cis-trans isomerase FKBP5-like isoform X1 n=1 Tax=Montipora foliosa TaxID=591990 RepID=UPI0035F16942
MVDDIDSGAFALPRTIIRKGIGLETPNYGSSCKVKLKIFSQDDTVSHTSEKDFVIGEGDNEFSETLDKCLECMHTKEVCVIPYKKENGNLEFASFSDGDLWCEIELLSFLKAKDPWHTTAEEKLTVAKHHKAKGTDCFKASNWLAASRRYSHALKQLILIGDKLPDDSKDEFEQLRVSCLLNLAACQGKLEQFEFVAENCTKVLAMSPTNLKALFRRGQAFVCLNEYEKAKDDLEKALTLAPCNSAVQEQLRILKHKQRLHDEKLSKALSAMFGRRKTSIE